MESSGEILRRLRVERALSLRTVASDLQLDIALLRKIEHGQRKASREQISRFAALFRVDENTLLTSWLTDEAVYASSGEEMSQSAMQLAEEKVAYLPTPASMIIQSIQSFFQTDGRVSAAWLFGSFARQEQKSNSDVDIMIELKTNKKYSIFDLIDISILIEKKIGKKVDLVEKGYLKDFANKTAINDLIKIYG
ncbi:nucleotidyltransferase domain-containing protein [Dyadobacter sp. 32]|uniref:nucleotidyltransferase domain-containing protein n=1 Tax=Dyadobacter sp. 32 TaxID=538966 RepID=UPI0011EE50FA